MINLEDSCFDDLLRRAYLKGFTESAWLAAQQTPDQYQTTLVAMGKELASLKQIKGDPDWVVL